MSRLTVVTLFGIAASACSNNSTTPPARQRSTSTAPAVTTTTQGELQTLSADQLNAGQLGAEWTSVPASSAADVDAARRARCPLWKPPSDAQRASQRSRTTLRRSAGPVPVIVVDVFRFATDGEALDQGQAHAEAVFVGCLRSTFEGAPLVARDVVVEALKSESLGGAQLGYRIAGVTGTGLDTEHVVVETLIFVVGDRVTLLTLSSSLRFPLDDTTRNAAINAVAALR